MATSEVVDVVVVEEEEQQPQPPGLEQRLDAMGSKLHGLMVAAKEASVAFRALQRDVLRLTRGRRTRRTAANPTGEDPPAASRAPSGFARPARLSDELCDFLGLPAGSMLPRTMVTKLISQYIKDNDLQKKDDKRRIVPNEKLRAILRLQENDTTYFQLQTHLKAHFEKNEQPTTTTEA